MPEII